MMIICSGGKGIEPRCTIIEDGPDGPLTIERPATEAEREWFERKTEGE